MRAVPLAWRMLKRKPTRIELKPDDREEYYQYKEKRAQEQKVKMEEAAEKKEALHIPGLLTKRVRTKK